MNPFSGIVTALATPFVDGEIDISSFRKLIQFQLENGVNGFVVNGTTAESPTLTLEEVQRLFDVARSEAGDDFPLILGTGSNCTAKTIAATERAKEWGANGALVVVPYYNKPTQEGMVAHFTKVAESVDIPLLLYNVPGRTIVGMDQQTITTLSKVDNICGVKEASGDVPFGQKLRESVGPDFTITSGDDPTCIDLCSKGGDGVVSVISHIIPKELKEFFVQSKEDSSANEKFLKTYSGLMDAIYSEPNPTGIKMALHKMGIFDSPEMRLPLVRMTKAGTQVLETEMKSLGLIS